eukprot:TRINITY_DN37484_c0_g1_i1.p1 TRINITY_DN37484_c0_g1~~TRINITY_DN37484_c0_g1_i1.p1  ORF type:complete len:512 (+),score=110.21 TRINITY_DN37484_c0_g1_i1:102-1637(+)
MEARHDGDAAADLRSLSCPGVARPMATVARTNLALLCLVGAIEGADLSLLPASFRALEANLGLGPSALSALALCQGVSGALAGPAWASLADRGMSRRKMLAGGAAGWGVLTFMLAFVTRLPTMMFLRSLNGIATATLSPLAQSIIADEVGASERGFYYGLLGFCRTSVGMVAASFVVTAISNATWQGIYGWRIAFITVSVGSLIISATILRFYEEVPRKWIKHGDERLSHAVMGELQKVLGYLRIRTFGLIVLEGMFGCIPFAAMSFMTMFLQYVGLTDVAAAKIVSLSLLASGTGALLGGIIGDRLHRWSPSHGRLLAAQASIGLGLPLAALIFQGIPRDESMFSAFLLACTALGLTCTWCESACNRPIFVEIVEPSSRASAFAWLCCIEWSIAQLVGLPTVGLLSEMCFGYQLRKQQVSSLTAEERHNNADALGKALVLSTLAPWVVAVIVYGFVHCTYKVDRVRFAAVSSKDAKTVEETAPLMGSESSMMTTESDVSRRCSTSASSSS